MVCWWIESDGIVLPVTSDPDQFMNHGKQRHWLFTLNNPDILPDEYLEKAKAWKDLRYIIFQLEKGEQGTEHYQGYVMFGKQRTFASLQKRKLAHTGNQEKGPLIRPVRIVPRKRHVYQGPMNMVLMKLAKELEQILNRLLLHSEMEVLNEYAKNTQIPMSSIVEGFIIFYYPMLDSEIDLERLAFYTVHLDVVKQDTSMIENLMDAQYPATMASGSMDTKDNEQCYWMTSMDAQANGHSTPAQSYR